MTHPHPDIAAPAPVSRFRDEVAWELVRDEWDLLLAIGAGPTSVASAAVSLGRPVEATAGAVALLVEHGLVRPVDGGYSLVPAFYERREGMASYLRDIVLDRLRADTSPPVAGAFRGRFLSRVALEAFVSEVETSLLPQVLELASRPESDASERFSVIFAVSDEVAPAVAAAGFRAQLLDVLRSAAAIRSIDPTRKTAYLWVAEMRADPHIAAELGDIMQQFFDITAPSPDAPPCAFGAAAFAVLSAPTRHRR